MLPSNALPLIQLRSDALPPYRMRPDTRPFDERMANATKEGAAALLSGALAVSPKFFVAEAPPRRPRAAARPLAGTVAMSVRSVAARLLAAATAAGAPTPPQAPPRSAAAKIPPPNKPPSVPNPPPAKTRGSFRAVEAFRRLLPPEPPLGKKPKRAPTSKPTVALRLRASTRSAASEPYALSTRRAPAKVLQETAGSLTSTASRRATPSAAPYIRASVTATLRKRTPATATRVTAKGATADPLEQYPTTTPKTEAGGSRPSAASYKTSPSPSLVDITAAVATTNTAKAQSPQAAPGGTSDGEDCGAFARSTSGEDEDPPVRSRGSKRPRASLRVPASDAEEQAAKLVCREPAAKSAHGEAATQPARRSHRKKGRRGQAR